MARTVLTLSDSSLDGTAITYNAVSATDGNYFINTGAEYLIVKNDSASSVTVTVKSVACSHGRTADSVVAVGAGASKVIGKFKTDLFNQKLALSQVYVDFSAATSVTAAVIKP